MYDSNFKFVELQILTPSLISVRLEGVWCYSGVTLTTHERQLVPVQESVASRCLPVSSLAVQQHPNALQPGVCVSVCVRACVCVCVCLCVPYYQAESTFTTRMLFK